MNSHVPRGVTALLAAALIMGAGFAGAATITIALDNVTETQCDTPWMEAGCSMWFTQTTAEDEYPGYCLVLPYIENGGNEGVYIYPARLVIDLSGVEGLDSVEVDVCEAHVPGSTRAFLYNEGAPVDGAQSYQDLTQTLFLSTQGAPVTQFAVSAHESAVWEVRLIGDTIAPTAPMTFSAVKAIYR